MQIRDKVCELNQQKMQCYLILVFMCSVLESSVVCGHALCEHAHVYRGGQKTHSSGAVNLIFRQGLFMDWSLPIRPDWLTSSQGNLLCVPPPVGVTVSSHHSWVFYVGSGDACKELSCPPPRDLSVILLCSYMYIIAIVFGSKTWFILAFAYEKLGELIGHACIRNK